MGQAPWLVDGHGRLVLAVVLRRGDAIEVIFENDRRSAVTVDDAATGAALLNGLITRLSPDS